MQTASASLTDHKFTTNHKPNNHKNSQQCSTELTAGLTQLFKDEEVVETPNIYLLELPNVQLLSTWYMQHYKYMQITQLIWLMMM